MCVCVCVCVRACACVFARVHAIVYVMFGRGTTGAHNYLHVYESVMWFRLNVRISAGKALHFALADDSSLLSILLLSLLKELRDFYMSLCVMES